MKRVHRTLIAAKLIATAIAGNAIPVPIDLLLGRDDFETAASLTRWDSGYTGTGFDWNAANIWAWESGSGHTGYNLPMSDDTVGNGWRRASSEGVNPATNIVYRLAPEGINGSKCQHFALRGLTSYGWAALLARIELGRTGSEGREGDTVAFQLEHIRMADYDGVNVDYSLRVRPSSDPSTWSVLALSKSTTPFAAELTATLPANPGTLTVEVIMTVSGGTGGRTPGIHVDGAHVFIKRSGQTAYENREAPAPRNRSTKTFKLFYSSAGNDEYAFARDYDYVVLSDENSLGAVPAIRAANPQAKIYLYKSAMVYKNDLGAKDHYYGNTPLGYRYVSSTHSEWLYSDGVSATNYVYNQDYPDTYYGKLANPDYQNDWVDKLLQKIGDVRLDGVFIDDIVDLRRSPSGDQVPILRPELALWETQQFMHGIVPRLTAAGLDVVQNSNNRLTSGPGSVYFNPFWTPSAPHDAPQYSSNTPSNVANPVREWSFFWMQDFYRDGIYTNYRRNVYDSTYWLRTLDDMAKVKEWNDATGQYAIPASQKKHLWMLVVGVDNPESDPAYGVDGWLRFGLASYLLGQNEWTLFGCGLRINYSADVDYSITEQLGEPDGDHMPYNNDTYFRYRRYKPSVGGAAGGVVVVNGNTDSSRVFTLDFDGTDEQGNVVSSGRQFTLKPHTGRIFLKQKGPVFVRIRTPSDAVTSGQAVTVTVDYLNSSTTDALGVVLRALVPQEMTYVPGSAEITGGSYDPATNTVTWRVGTVVGEHSGRRTFKAKVK